MSRFSFLANLKLKFCLADHKQTIVKSKDKLKKLNLIKAGQFRKYLETDFSKFFFFGLS